MKSISHWLSIATAAACLSIAAGVQAQGREHDLNIERQRLSGALNDFSRQTGLQIAFLPGDMNQNLWVGPLSGRYDAEAALTQLLESSGLSFRRVNERTITVVGAQRQSSVPRSAYRRISSTVEGGFLRVADVRLAAAANAQVSPQAASSAESNNGRRNMEEVLVTAQRREERLQDVPISISVMSGEVLDRSTNKGVTEALSRVAGVTVDEVVQGGGTQVSMRGVSSPIGSYFGSSPIGYYLDTVPFGLVRSAIAPDPDVFDLNRVEVLRGPQGTLYGASAQGGVVRVLTNDADLDKLEFKARGLASSTEGGSENYRGDVAANVPLIDGKLAARAVIGYQQLGGWIDKPTQENANDTEMTTARLKVNGQLTDRLSLGISGWISRSDMGAPSFADDDQRSPVADTEALATDFEVYALKLGYDFSAFALSSHTSYLDYFNDGDILLAPGSPTAVGTTFYAKTFSQEVNLSSTHGGNWRWTAGAMYRDGRDRRPQSLTGLVSAQTVALTSESWAAFGELTRILADGRFEVTAGLRYFEDDVGMREEARFGTAVLTNPVNRDSTFHSTTPRVILTWKPQDDFTAYASYSEGFRSGFDQLPSVLLGAPTLGPAEPDLLKNYEVGAKGKLWDGRLNYDSAVYYLDWEDVQLPITQLIGGTGFASVINGASASGPGIDLSLAAEVLDGFVVGLNSSWNDLTVDSDVISGGIVLFEDGSRLNYSAEYTVGLSADYDFSLGGSGLSGRLSAAVNHTSERSFRSLVGAGVFTSEGDPITVGRVSFAVDSSEAWSATLFVDNVSNEEGSVSGTIGLTQAWWATRIRPRTVGVQLEYRY